MKSEDGMEAGRAHTRIDCFCQRCVTRRLITGSLSAQIGVGSNSLKIVENYLFV